MYDTTSTTSFGRYFLAPMLATTCQNVRHYGRVSGQYTMYSEDFVNKSVSEVII